MLSNIVVLLILFQLKHFVADYPLQGKYMLQKFRPDWGFFLPLLAHAGVHAVMTLVVCLVFAPHLWWLSLVDLSIHFVMDRIKAGPKYLGRFKALSGAEYMQTVSDEHWAELNQDNDELAEISLKRKNNVYFWWSLGLDQMVHHVVHYFIIFMIVAGV